jgi:RNA recognition motif-containing protein
MNKVETVSENKKSDRNLGHNIYVAGLSTRTEEADLEELFHPFGEVMIILFRIY